MFIYWIGALLHENIRTAALWLMFSLVTGSGMLFTLSPTIIEVKQDAWISAAFGGVVGLCIVFLAVKLSLLYPDQTFVQYSQQILGKWLGKIIIVPYFALWYSLDGMILRDSSEFVYLALFNKTPV
ncbi:Spore germination protein [Paenibacillus tianmuensis]|uniref:Spore germination protein n=1 Tax=Paenibacillus tianmuensis TaxID=624147 RepID=A0A1G4R156_9BACL|nr:GerAB/ArcD/ProY family transporter [Paenibacillus tianmuensis]SCW49939.1 Spore germination protein [Paenibacillus tianmuensis]